MVERGDELAPHILEKIYPHSGNAYYIGVTGPPGAGKSSLVDRLVRLHCQNGFSVGIIAVDPSSPFTGGALLGDRVRVNMEHEKWNVFFRSMSAGKTMGGLARAAKDAARILDAGGKQIIIIETVGVGQSELDIAQATDTVMVVLVPEAGDVIQTLKAGLMEIADIYVVNKADRPAANSMADAIEGMLDQVSKKTSWRPPVFLTAATRNQGIQELYEGLWGHHRYLKTGHHLKQRRKAQLRTELLRCIEDSVSELVRNHIIKEETVDALVDAAWRKQLDVHGVAREVVNDWIKGLKHPGADDGVEN